jgi:hypothetical protein
LAVRATILKPRICDLSVLMERFTQPQGQQSGLTLPIALPSPPVAHPHAS